MFSGQDSQAEGPDALLCVPTAHASHAPSGPVKPASHGHTVSAVPRLPEFAGQLVQACEPLPLLYVGATHAVHEPPSGPEYPALQRQAVESVHGVHVPPEKNGQPVHDPDPVALFHVPVGHAEHGPPSGPVYPALQPGNTAGNTADRTSENGPLAPRVSK